MFYSGSYTTCVYNKCPIWYINITHFHRLNSHIKYDTYTRILVRTRKITCIHGKYTFETHPFAALSDTYKYIKNRHSQMNPKTLKYIYSNLWHGIPSANVGGN